MSLTPPKRLFHVPSMSTVFYRDVADNVRNKGYVTISHVWGEQQMHSADKLGIKSGVNWKIPLSNPNKMNRLINAMNHHKMEYCWFDVLCMPQNRQDLINLEIPLMGDYYSGANMTLVLGTISYYISDKFKAWIKSTKTTTSTRKLGELEHTWLASLVYKKEILLDISDEVWFTRAWTMQETVMSREVILCDIEGKYFNLTNLFPLLEKISCTDPNLHRIFRSTYLYDVNMTTFVYKSGTGDLVTTLHLISERDCYKPQDKFYAALGILGYKDFIVDYTVSMEDLNKSIVKHAYSKGDISWMSVYGVINKGFLQPMYRKLPVIGTCWKEIGKHITFEDDFMFVYSRPFAIITRCEKYRFGTSDYKFVKWIVLILVSWGYNPKNIVDIITGFKRESEIIYEIVEKLLRLIITSANRQKIEENFEYLAKIYSIHDLAKAENALILVNIMYSYSNLVEATLVDTNKKIALMVYGNANIGDEIKMLNMYNKGKILGIIISNTHERKALTYYRTDKASAFYKPCKVML